MKSGLNPNSMLYWWPLVKDLGIPVPRTIIVEQPREGFLRELTWAVCGGDELPEGANEFAERVREACDQLGYPCFLRSDLFSAKHEWENTCFVPDRDSVGAHIGDILAEAEMVDMTGMDHRAFVVREFLSLQSTFTAFRGLPVARERRYFVRDGEVVCHHPYWPQAAVKRGCPVHPEWRELLRELNREHPISTELLTERAQLVAQAMPGYWSVDFAYSVSDAGCTWFLIDMARGEESWHPDCAAIGTATKGHGHD